jgi:hypothetical protein
MELEAIKWNKPNTEGKIAHILSHLWKLKNCSHTTEWNNVTRDSER